MNSDDAQGIEAGWDALPDTMTNVVGVLIIVLAVVYLGVQGAVERVQKTQAQPTPTQQERFSATARQENDLDLRLKLARDRWRQVQRQLLISRSGQAELRARVSRVIRPPRALGTLPDTSGAELDTRTLAKKEARALADVSRLEQQLKAVSTELQQRKALPVPKVTVARVPDPTPAPSDAAPLVLFCRYGRVLVYPVDAMAAKLHAGIAEAMSSDGQTAFAIKPADFQRIQQHFDQHPVGIGGLRWRLRAVDRLNQKTGDVHRELTATAEWTQLDLGETVAQLQAEDSEYMQKLEPSDDRIYGKFYVWGDSFAEYAVAREMMDAKGISAGWIACDEPPVYRIALSTQVARLMVREPGMPMPAPKLRPGLVFVPKGRGGGWGRPSGPRTSAVSRATSYTVMGSGPGIDMVD